MCHSCEWDWKMLMCGNNLGFLEDWDVSRMSVGLEEALWW